MNLPGYSHIKILLLVIIPNFYSASSIPTVVNPRADFSRILASFRTATFILANNNTSSIRENVSLCKRDITSLSTSAIAGEKWALEMLDASSKIQAGILKGNVHDLGMYDQCVEVVPSRNPANIKGEHCMVSLAIPPKLFVDESSMMLMQMISPLGQRAGEDALGLTLSMCMPSSCNEEDVFGIMNRIIDQTPDLVKPGISVAEVTCSRVEDEDSTFGEILAIIFVAAVVIFLTFCTICDILQRTRCYDSVTLKFFSPFSLYTNSIDLLSTKVSPGAIPAIHGLRVLSMCWVLIVHRCFVTVISPVANLADVLEWQNRWYSIFAFMISFTVDISFVISGFVTSHQFLRSMNSGERFNLPIIYFHRYVRLTPCLAVLMLLTVSQLRHIGSGPVWKPSMDLMVIPCEENWWTNLFYVQNLVNTKRMCLPHTWYLAVDMQLFWISRIILYALFRWRKYAWSIVTSSLLISIFMSPLLFFVNGHTSAFFKLTKETSVPEFRANFVNVYMSIIHRSSAYLIGVTLGYVIVNTKSHLTMLQVRVNWAISCLLMSICVIATHHLYSETYAYDIVFEVAYAALARPAWAIAIAWVVFASAQGYGDVVTEFLSSPAFLPLSRLSYCIYLVHLVMQVSTAALARTPVVFSKFQIFHLFWGDMAISIGLGFLLSLFIETPLIVLERVIKGIGPGRSTPTQKSSNGYISSDGIKLE